MGQGLVKPTRICEHLRQQNVLQIPLEAPDSQGNCSYHGYELPPL